MGNSGNTYIAHYGVKGMKWGVRKDKYKKMSFGERRRAKADYRVARGTKNSKGGHGKARAVGVSLIGGTRGVVAGILIDVGKNTVVGLSDFNPTVLRGANAVAFGLNTVSHVSSLIDAGYALTSDKNKK